MKEIRIEQTELVCGGGLFESILKIGVFVKSKSPAGIITHSSKLNENNDKHMKEILEHQNRDRRERSRHGYNRRQGNYRRGEGGREIEF